jgi:hypothetical protein
MQIMRRDAGKGEICFAASGDGGQILYLCIRGQAVQVLAADCCCEVLAPAVSVRHTTPHLTSPGLQIPGMQRFLVKPLPQILSDVG